MQSISNPNSLFVVLSPEEAADTNGASGSKKRCRKVKKCYWKHGKRYCEWVYKCYGHGHDHNHH